nr:NXPE family member 3-like [Lytechinus pictus]
MASRRWRLYIGVVCMGSLFIVYVTMHLTTMDDQYIHTSPRKRASHKLFENLAEPKALTKEWTNLTVHPFCPNLMTKQRRRRYTYEDNIPSHVSWTSLLDMTSPNFTTFHIAGRPSRFLVCDELRLTIQARNGLNESKIYGGDYFRAKIYTKNSTFQASSMSDGEVADHGNGTYSALFTLKWAGLVNIQVTLVHTSEANYVLRRLQKEEAIRMSYISKFYSKKSEKSAEAGCYMDLNVLQKSKAVNGSCNFTDTRTGTPWFCLKPANFSCDDWSMQHSVEHQSVVFPIDHLSFTWSNRLITGSDHTIVVHHEPGKESVVHNGALVNLPPCKPKTHFGTPEVAGFYWGTNFHSPDCALQMFDRSQATSLLKNKTVYFFGDSTIRQLFEFYTKLFNLKTSPKSKRNPKWYVGPTRAIDKKNNISLYFQFHGHPIGRATWANVSTIQYIANLIDRVKGGENTVLVLTLWAHFASFPPWYYDARVEDMLMSVRRLHERSPRTLVVWKSANTREHKKFDHYIKNSDWTARDLDRRMRNKVFAHENLGFMDAWDMTNAQFEKDFVHPKGPHVQNLSNKLLSYVLNHDKSK